VRCFAVMGAIVLVDAPLAAPSQLPQQQSKGTANSKPLPTPSPTPTQIPHTASVLQSAYAPSLLEWTLGAVAVSLFIFLVAALIVAYQRQRTLLEEVRDQARRSDENRTQPSDAAAGPPPQRVQRGPEPRVAEMPDDLSTAIASGKAVLFAGAGLAPHAGLPSWADVLFTLSRRVIERDARNAELYETSLARGDLEALEGLLAQDLSVQDRNAALIAAFAQPRGTPQLYRDLGSMPFAYIITSMFDDGLERALRYPAITVSGDGDRLDEALRYGETTVVKLNGELRDPSTIRFTTDEYRNALVENPTFAKTIASIVLSRPVFYVGATVAEIQRFLSESTPRQRADQPHFALIRESADWKVSAHLLGSRYGVTVISYVPGPNDNELGQFVARLAREVETKRRALPEPPRRGASNPEEACITHVSLLNIGPFESAEFDLNPKLNVILGINGAGKSTVLKAIALCLCGDDPAASSAGEQLLNRNADRGSIVLTIAGAACRTDLVRERGRVRVTANRLTPLQRGVALALGFPALRAAFPGNPTGPAANERQWPEAADVVPLLNVAADRRLGSFKQWIVNLDARSSTEIDAAKRNRYDHQLHVAFRPLRSLSGNASVRFARVDRQTWSVLVATPDVPELPLELVSQGMTSLLAWIGVTLERCSEINPDLDAPERAPALILIDEIDAHLHPSWQRELIGVLRDIFPNIQLIATTHSPLIVGGMEANEVFLARRERDDPKHVEFFPLGMRFKGLRVDQILATIAFDMPTTREPESTELVRKYEALNYKTDRSPDEDRQRQELARNLDPFFFAGVTQEEIAAERRQAEQLDDPDSLINRHLSGALTPDERAAILAALNDSQSGPEVSM